MDGNRFLLDTNAIIAMQKDDERILALLATPADIFIPVIAVGELYYGAYKSQRIEKNRQAVVNFLANRILLAPDHDTADMYGQVKAGLRDIGRPIPENDIWIAALALQHGLTVVTHDTHFTEVEGLRLRDWTQTVPPTNDGNDT